MMLDWISEKISAAIAFVPALFVDEGSPNFGLIRSMFVLFLIVLVVYVVAIRPLRALIGRSINKQPRSAAPK